MKLPEMFHSRARKLKSAWHSALENGDAAAAASVLDAGFMPDQDGREDMISKGSAEILEIFVQKRANEINSNGAWRSIGEEMTCYALWNKRFDQIDILLNSGINFNYGYYSFHPVCAALSCDAGKEKKLEWLEKITAGGVNKIHDINNFMAGAVIFNLKEAVDMAVKLGISPRQNNDMPLKLAAEVKNKELCIYLIDKYGADIEAAKSLPGPGTKNYLTALQKEMYPQQLPPEKPVTLETLAEEMKTMRETMAELAQLIKNQNDPDYVRRLDKPAPLSKSKPASP